ncbi:ras-related protein Rab-32 isoform X1 [Onthophagus taurus]|uniref:ras-related protein Rab-32 isoform X1 n=2 Tax=Onthophagus taurus TaxID=166361 RepID=UPI000C20F7D0|nr:ras-related protein Rab-32 isoform X1 [Onthophagus taurus]
MKENPESVDNSKNAKKKLKPKKTSLIKRLKLKTKHSSQSDISIEPQPSTSSESSALERRTPEGDDTDITLGKSVSDTNLSDSSWKSAENLTADKRKGSSKSVINVETTQVEVTVEEKDKEKEFKSSVDLKDMPAFGELIFDTTMTSSNTIARSKDHLYKILVIGDLGTGKTSIIKRYVHQFFSQHYRATIGVDFALKVINWDQNTLVRLQLWDIAGQERYGNMTRVYYKEAVGAFIVFDVTRSNTFDSVSNWKADLDSKVQLSDGSPIPCVLLANKCDQPKEGLVASPSRMDDYCREKGFTAWFETSAKENINIDDAARALVSKILDNDALLSNNKGDQFTLHDETPAEKSSCTCKLF